MPWLEDNLAPLLRAAGDSAARQSLDVPKDRLTPAVEAQLIERGYTLYGARHSERAARITWINAIRQAWRETEEAKADGTPTHETGCFPTAHALARRQVSCVHAMLHAMNIPAVLDAHFPRGSTANHAVRVFRSRPGCLSAVHCECLEKASMFVDREVYVLVRSSTCQVNLFFASNTQDLNRLAISMDVTPTLSLVFPAGTPLDAELQFHAALCRSAVSPLQREAVIARLMKLLPHDIRGTSVASINAWCALVLPAVLARDLSSKRASTMFRTRFVRGRLSGLLFMLTDAFHALCVKQYQCEWASHNMLSLVWHRHECFRVGTVPDEAAIAPAFCDVPRAAEHWEAFLNGSAPGN